MTENAQVPSGLRSGAEGGSENSGLPGSETGGDIAPVSTALLVIDVQRDFAAPDGLIGRAGADLSAAEAAIDRIAELIPAARKAGVTIVFLRVVTEPDTDSDALKAYYSRRGQPGGHGICRKDDPGSAYYRVAPEPGDIEVTKLLYDSFHETDLEQKLRERGIDTLFLCGLTTDCCVDTTARAAFHRNFHVFVVPDACASYDQGLHDAAIGILEKHCALPLSADALLSAWSKELAI